MPSNTYDTTNPGSAVSNFEDLSNMVHRVVPEITPVTTLAPKGKCTAANPEWTLDKLKDPSSLAGGVSEGVDVSSFSDQHGDRAKVGNYIQRVRDTWSVSREQQVAASAGPANKATAKAKAVINVKRATEYVLCSDNDKQAENGAGNPYKTRALGDWIDSAGPSDVPSAYRTPSASIETNGTSTTEAEFQAVVQSLWDASGDTQNVTLVAASALRSQISSFTRTEGASTDRTYSVNEDATSKKITYAVSFFDTDFGMISMMTGNTDCMPATDRGYFLNQSGYELLIFDPMRMVELEDQGGGERGYCDWAFALCVKNPRYHGKIS